MAYDAQPVELEWAQAVLNLPSGLPLTGFLTPGGKLYFGGTYFPRETQGDKVEGRLKLDCVEFNRDPVAGMSTKERLQETRYNQPS